MLSRILLFKLGVRREELGVRSLGSLRSDFDFIAKKVDYINIRFFINHSCAYGVLYFIENDFTAVKNKINSVVKAAVKKVYPEEAGAGTSALSA